MHIRKYTIFLTSALTLNGMVYGAAQEKIVFSPIPSVEAKIAVHDQVVNIELKSGLGVTQEAIQIETEKKLSIQVEDYNFDGRQDFSVSHLDDGMGTYVIYQIYVFSAQNRKFEILRPKCGDDFINVSLSRKKRILTNSYFADNQMKTCAMRY